jgi:hypothetical protein
VGDEWGRMIKEKDEQIAQLMEEGVRVALCTRPSNLTYSFNRVHL